MEQGSDWIQYVQTEGQSLGWESPGVSLMLESGGLAGAEWMERPLMTVCLSSKVLWWCKGAEGWCLLLVAVQLYC